VSGVDGAKEFDEQILEKGVDDILNALFDGGNVSILYKNVSVLTPCNLPRNVEQMLTKEEILNQATQGNQTTHV